MRNRKAPKLLAVSTEVPACRIAQDEAAALAREVFGGIKGLDRLVGVFESSRIRTRYFCTPPSWFLETHSAETVNRLYVENATALSASALTAALERCGLQPETVDYLVFVSTTGLATPSIDARLINQLSFRPDVRHTPVWGRGCAGGTFGLSHACDYLRASPKGIAVVVTAEFCGLTFVPQDPSKSNVVASALFGDGVAAAVLGGAEVEIPGYPIVSTRSHLFPDSLDVMGWNIGSQGLQVVFNRHIPELVREHAAPLLENLLRGADVKREEVCAYLFHPGGRKVLEAYEDALSLTGDDLELSWGVLADYGNMSSSTVLFVIERFLGAGRHGVSGYAVASALGPGFCAESLLLGLPRI